MHVRMPYVLIKELTYLLTSLSVRPGNANLVQPGALNALISLDGGANCNGGVSRRRGRRKSGFHRVGERERTA